MEYSLEFEECWDSYFKKLDSSMRGRVWKKIQQLKGSIPSRHLKKGLDFYVSEIGQYMLCYKINEKAKVKTIYFVGDHKEYEKWLGI